jgi:ectoine hydroxylase
MPSTLCAAVDQYHREGFLLRPGFFAHEVALLEKLIDSERERLQALEDLTIDSAGREASCLGYLGHGDDVVTSFAATERLVNLVSELLGDDVYLLKGKLNVKWGADAPERRGGWDPHQDRAAWAREGLPGKDTLSVAIAIDRSDTANGTIQVLPGSHADGLVEHTQIGQGYGIPDRIYRQLCDRHERVPVIMDAGDVLLFSGDVVHLSEPNLDDRRRAVLFLTFNALSNSPAKGVGPSRYFCTQALQSRDDRILAGLVRQFEKGQYEPQFDWDTFRYEREIEIAEGIDSGWTSVTRTQVS